MLTVAQLWSIIDAHANPAPPRRVPLGEVAGLVLAGEVRADRDQPAFDRSAMDGYAVAAGALPGTFRLVGEILPGQPAPAAPGIVEALRVFTGSALPAGVRVVMQEDVLAGAKDISIASIGGKDHVRRRGSAARQGDILLSPGVRLGPAEIALLASVGEIEPAVISAPRVVHLTTGSEIVPASQTPGPGEIRDTNGPLVRALVESCGAHYAAHRHVSESVDDALRAASEIRSEEADVLLISGGASVGGHDHTAEVLRRLGFELLCTRVLCRPGKPLIFGVDGRRLAFGLPGNPVSHFAVFHAFVRRALSGLMGLAQPTPLRARLEGGVPLVADARETFWPTRLDFRSAALCVGAVDWLDSGDLGSLRGVDALIRLPASAPAPSQGDAVEVLSAIAGRWAEPAESRERPSS